ncbi:MAG: hypothetical protein GY861_09830 [bacterium]|nr:hypothetical protein [bacterium]
MSVGVNPIGMGLMVRRENTNYFLAPSQFALAEIGLMKPGDVKRGLEAIVESGESEAINKWAANGGRWKDIEGQVQELHEGSKNFLRESVIESGTSVLGLEALTVRRRGSGRKERHRKLFIRNPRTLDDKFEEGFDYSCQCPTFILQYPAKNTLKIGEVIVGKESTTNVACYHIATGLINRARDRPGFELPFKFTQKQVYETLLRRYTSGKSGRKYARSDRHLLKEGVTTEFANRMIKAGNATIETVRHSFKIEYGFSVLFKETINYLEKNGFEYKGHATEFPNRKKETTSLVFTKGDMDMRIVYDKNLGSVPLLLQKRHNVKTEEKTKKKKIRHIELAKTYKETDMRTQSECSAVLMKLPQTILDQCGERIKNSYHNRYETFAASFKPIRL